MTSLIAAALLAAQAPAPAPAPQWEIIFEGPNAAIAIDAASIRRTGDVVRLRRRSHYRETGTDGMRWLIVEATIDCAARTHAMQRMEGYREDGSLIRAIDTSTEPARPLPPGAGESGALFTRICERAAG